jgi:hypothetical protein
MNLNPFDWPIAGYALILSIIAFFRSDIERLARKFRRRSIVQADIGVEFGFTAFGPMCILVGSLVTAGEERVFSRMRFTVRRKSDGATHVLHALFEKPANIFLTNAEIAQKSSIWHPIAVKDNFSRPMHVVFCQKASMKFIQSQSQTIINMWHDYIKDVIPDEIVAYSASIGDHFHKFIMNSDVINITEQIRDLNFWRPGEYAGKWSFTLADGSEEPAGEFNFEITKFEYKELLANSIGVLQYYIGSISREPYYYSVTKSNE